MFYTINLIYPFNKMILGSPELDKFEVKPWMIIESFDPKEIKKLDTDHPYKYLLWSLYKYNPSYNSTVGNDASPDYDGYDDDVADYYFKILDDFNRYGIVFSRNFDVFPGNKLYVHNYSVLSNHLYNEKTLLFNKAKVIYLNDYDKGEKPLSKEEEKVRDFIKKTKNKKLQVAMMDPVIYNKLLKNINSPLSNILMIEKFNHRMTWYGFDDFLRINMSSE